MEAGMTWIARAWRSIRRWLAPKATRLGPGDAMPGAESLPPSEEGPAPAEPTHLVAAMPSFDVKIEAAGEGRQGASDERDRRRAFWQQASAAPNFDQTSADDYHTRFVAGFGKALFEQARLLRAEKTGRDNEPAQPLPDPAFDFRVENVRYGSLLFSVEILGLGSLVKYLLGEPELVLALIHAGVAPAFASATGISEADRRLDFATTLSPELRSTLMATPSQGEPPRTTHAAESTGWSVVGRLLVQHAPYLMPIILAFIVLAIAYSGLSLERDRLLARESALAAREGRLIDATSARASALEAVTLQLIDKLHKDSPASQPSPARRNTTPASRPDRRAGGARPAAMCRPASTRDSGDLQSNSATERVKPSNTTPAQWHRGGQ